MKIRNAFTLVELLVVIALMGILAGMMTYAMAGARQEAREKRARAEIAAINAILMQKMNEINLAPVLLTAPFVPPRTASLPHPAPPNDPKEGIESNRVTMLGRRELARMILPQCRADLIYPPARLQYRKRVNSTNSLACATKIKEPSEWGLMRRLAGFVFPRGIDVNGPAVPPSPGNPGFPLIESDDHVMGISAEDPLYGPNGYFSSSDSSLLLRRRLGAIRGSDGFISEIDLTTAPWGANDPNNPWTREYESAECLYLILASTEMYGERALDQFSARSIANLDGDAVPEIVDPWGVPYEFIRDATGAGFPFFGNSIVYSTNLSNFPAPDQVHPAGGDSSDYLRTDLRDPTAATKFSATYRITPLVVSAGIDGEFGIRRSFNPSGNVADGTAGISPRHSMTAVRLTDLTTAPALTPVLPVGSYQYPDPFASVEDLDPNFSLDRANLRSRTLNGWFRGNGLGARIHNGSRFDESSADNIYSVGGL